MNRAQSLPVRAERPPAKKAHATPPALAAPVVGGLFEIRRQHLSAARAVSRVAGVQNRDPGSPTDGLGGFAGSPKRSRSGRPTTSSFATATSSPGQLRAGA